MSQKLSCLRHNLLLIITIPDLWKVSKLSHPSISQALSYIFIVYHFFVAQSLLFAGVPYSLSHDVLLTFVFWSGDVKDGEEADEGLHLGADSQPQRRSLSTPITVCSVFTWKEEASSSERVWLRAWCALLDWCHRTGPSHQSSCLGQKQLQQLEEMCGSASAGNTWPGSTSTSIMGHDSCLLEFLSLSSCSFFQLVGNSRPENDQQ